MEKGLQKERKLRISILGDSISTFAGYTPKDSVFYDSYVQWETGVKTVEDTWWMQVIRAFEQSLALIIRWQAVWYRVIYLHLLWQKKEFRL